MKVETFYNIVGESGKVLAGNYSTNEYQIAKDKLIHFAKMYPDERISLMKRVSSVTSKLVWEDSE
jgi:hypothetical protein